MTLLEKIFTQPKNDEITQAITSEFAKFLQSGEERVVFSINDLDKEVADEYRASLPGGWRTLEEGQHSYYPHDLLDEREHSKIQKGTQYQTLAFVRPNALGIAPNEEAGIEIMTRVNSYAMLPKFKPESQLNYNTIKTFFSEKDFPDFLSNLTDKEYPQTEFKEDFEAGNEIYQGKTAELFLEGKKERDKVLAVYDARNAPADEHLFQEMRSAIYDAKK